MPRIELPTGLEGAEDFLRSRRALTNCYNNLEGQIMPTPGITQLNTTSGIARGQFVWNSNLYQITGTSLIKITDVSDGTFSTIGTISGSEIVKTVIGDVLATILVEDGAIYTLDTSDTLTLISGNDNFVPCSAHAHIDGIIVYIPSDGSPAFFSDVDAPGTVQALSVFDAEELPDKNETVFNFNGLLYIAGTDSIEIFKNTGADPVPFERLTGSRISVGFIGALIEYNDAFIFIGREKDQDASIYALAPRQAIKVSNQPIDLILTEHTQNQLAEAVGARYRWRGFDIGVFTIGQTSFGITGENWFFLETVNDLGIPGKWGGGFVTQFQGTYFTAFENKIGKLAKINTDYGNPHIKTIDAGFLDEDNANFSCQSIEIDVTQGFSASPGTVGLVMTDNNIEYGPTYFRDLGVLGAYGTLLEWNAPGGLGLFEGFMGIRLTTPSDIVFSTSIVAYFR